MTADDLFNLLNLKFPPREYALLAQVRNCTGFSRQIRTADALVMSLWPSRGLELSGVEIKIERRDWLREKDDPEKADAIGKYCDRWWIVTPPGIVEVVELPPAWGLMEWDEEKKKWKVRQAAGLITPKPFTRDFLASILRNIAETTVPHAAIEDRVEKGLEAATDNKKRQLDAANEELRMLKQRILDFEKASGVALGINGWTIYEPKEMGAAVRRILNGDDKRIKERLEALKHQAEAIVKDVTRHLEKQP